MRKVSRFRAFVDVLRWRRIPVRDAAGRVKLVRVSSRPFRITLGRALLGLIWVAIAAGGGMAAGKRGGALAGTGTALLVLVGPYIFSTLDRFKETGRAHVRRKLLKDRCPWCDRLLLEAKEDNLRRCRCKGSWWDVPGIEPGTSARKHTEHVLAINIAVFLGGLGLGFFQFGCLSSGEWGKRLAGAIFVLVFGAGAGSAVGGKGADWRVAGIAVGTVPFILGILWLRGANADAGAAMVVAGLVTGAATMAGTRLGASLRTREVRRGIGRICADCGYNMRALEPGDPCPECGSRVRVR